MASSSRLREADSAPDVEAAYPSYDYPRDEFDVDDWAGPVGAHRAARKGWLVAFPWLAAAAAILLITGLALALGLGRHHGKDTAAPATTGSAASGTGSAGATSAGGATSSGAGTAASGTVNRQTQIQILNSTRRNGVAHTLQVRMKKDGWNVPSVSTYRGGKTLPSVVYYRDAKDAATAAEVAKLYSISTKQSTTWNSPITLMIGTGFPSQ